MLTAIAVNWTESIYNTILHLDILESAIQSNLIASISAFEFTKLAQSFCV